MSASAPSSPSALDTAAPGDDAHAPASPEGARPAGRRRPRVLGLLDRRAALVAGVALTAWLPRVLTARAGFETFDEGNWQRRSARFVDVLAAGDLGEASATHDGLATMPGVTTMWTGAVARGVWGLGRGVGLWAGEGQTSFATSDSGRILGQLLMAGSVTLLIGLLTVLVAKWAGWRAAVVAGVVVATEPFLVAHGAVFHTDEMRELFGACSLVATALALGLPHAGPWAGRRGVALAAGALFGGALLTKLAALTLLPSVVVLAVWAAWRARPRIRPVARTMGWWTLAAALTCVVLYPALWVHPWGELGKLRESAGLASSGELQFFLGRATQSAGPLFYVVGLPLRTTPWLLVAGLVAAVAIWRRGTRGYGGVLVTMALPSFVVLSLASKQYARYGLLLLIVSAIAVGIVVSALLDARAARAARAAGPGSRATPGAEVPGPGRRPRISWVRATGVAAWAVAGVHALLVAPWGLAYFNPLLGGASTAERTVEIGKGEGTEEVDERIRRLVDGRCDGVTVTGFVATAQVTCGRVVLDIDEADFYVIYVSERQRMSDEERAAKTAGRDLVDRVVVRGITYVEIFGPADTPSPP